MFLNLMYQKSNMGECKALERLDKCKEKSNKGVFRPFLQRFFLKGELGPSLI